MEYFAATAEYSKLSEQKRPFAARFCDGDSA